MWIAILAGLALALCWWLIWRLTTDAEKIDRALRSASGNFLEIGLYKDYPRPMLQSLGSLNGASLRLGWLLLPPSLLFLLPLFIIGFCVWSSLAFRPLVVGEAVLVSAQSIEPMELKLPMQLVLEAGPVRVKDSSTTYWRVRGEEKGYFPFEVVGPQSTLHGYLNVENNWPPPKSGFISTGVQVDYPRRELWIGTRRIHYALAVFLTFLIALPLTAVILPARRKKREK